MSSWPTVRLGEVLRQYDKYIDAPEPREYRKLSVRLYGKGVALDAPADGATLKMQRHQIAKAGQIVLSEIWGKKGAIGFVPPEGDGALCTSHFFLFDCLAHKADPRWLQAIFSANYLEDQLCAEAKGTTGYAAVRPKTLLACSIPLPPLSEQRRIVGRIEELAGEVATAQRLRSEVEEGAEALVLSLHVQLSGDRTRKLGDILSLDEDVAPVTAVES
ncbi:MAG: restriction endonuclease subunit S, partial [bacterium]